MMPGTQPWRRRAALRLGGVGLAAVFLAGPHALAAGAIAEEAAMQAVCAHCHNIELVTQRPRSESEWIDIFNRMVELGATGTDEQFDAVGRYILTRLTQIRINDAPATELTRLLDVPDSVAAAIVARREREKFRDMADLASVPGLDASRIAGWESRIIF